MKMQCALRSIMFFAICQKRRTQSSSDSSDSEYRKQLMLQSTQEADSNSQGSLQEEEKKKKSGGASSTSSSAAELSDYSFTKMPSDISPNATRPPKQRWRTKKKNASAKDCFTSLKIQTQGAKSNALQSKSPVIISKKKIILHHQQNSNSFKSSDKDHKLPQ